MLSCTKGCFVLKHKSCLLTPTFFCLFTPTISTVQNFLMNWRQKFRQKIKNGRNVCFDLLSGGKHFTFKCTQRESLPEVKTSDEDVCAIAPATKKKTVLFSSSPDEILGKGMEDLQLSDEETLQLDAEELKMQRQPSLQMPLTPSTSEKGEILATEYLSNVGIFSKNVATRAVMVYFYKLSPQNRSKSNDIL